MAMAAAASMSVASDLPGSGSRKGLAMISRMPTKTLLVNILAGNDSGAGPARVRKKPLLVANLAVGLAIGLAIVWSWAAANNVFAQQKPSPAKPAPVQQQQTQQQQTQQQQQKQPAPPVSTEQALYLIRSTLLTLNDANRSGNYTVLRDLAAPDFQARNTAADLSQIFSDLRRRNFDLYGTALLAPQLTAVPALDQRGFLHLAGYFSTQPQQINFDLLFQVIANQWRLYGISVSTVQPPSAAR
jgi:hypothetical protein